MLDRLTRFSLLWWALGVGVPALALAHHVDLKSIPAIRPAPSWPVLYDVLAPKLQQALEGRLYRNRQWGALLRKRKMAVGIVDLTHPEAPRFARLNGDTMMYAASLPKIAVLLAAFQAFAEGTLVPSETMMDDLRQMIRYSNNAATTRMIDRLGFEAIAAVLMAPKYQLFDPRHGGGLWVGKRYAKQGRRYPDPLRGLSHAATVTQVCRFYYLLATGRLIDPERSQQMLAMLANPGLEHKFVATLARQVPKTRLYRKSGTWRSWHADSVLVWGERWRRYILVGLVEDRRGEAILRNLVSAIEEVLH